MKIEIQGVTKRFGSVVALDSIDLAIEDSEFFFLLGPSGCGKTTLLRILAGFEKPDAGRVLFDGKDVTDLPPEKRQSGMVFQNYALWPHLTVERNISFGLEVQSATASARSQRVEEMLKLVQMTGYGSRRPGQLSGGQQQRVALARALAIAPELVLLDEPLSNLDARLRAEMRTELRGIIKQADRTAVYVTHDQKEALSMADRCAILRNGSIEQIGPPHEVYLSPANRFVADFLGDASFIPGVVEETGEGNSCRIRLSAFDSIWEGRASSAIAVGASVICCIRPEAWKVNPPPGPLPIRVQGTIENSTYLGEITQHEVRLNSESNLLVRVTEIHAIPTPPRSVELGLDPRDVVVLPV